ncbi:hypothetical protein KDX30_28440, partial [Pseudomonas sp. CDFA 553]|uniref:hypothetical protein n=1 Tax=Pseudomonas quasicaspiana TaxID=2829821 RepID=UPI001E4971EA
RGVVKRGFFFCFYFSRNRRPPTAQTKQLVGARLARDKNTTDSTDLTSINRHYQNKKETLRSLS